MIIEERVERSQYVKLITWISFFYYSYGRNSISCPNTLGKSGYDVKGYWCLRFMSYLFYFDFYCCLSTTETYLVRNAYNYGTYIGAGVYLLFRYN